ncbi:MFS transporter [Geodermatophilus nigrescens]|uniref:MFS transporter, YNFM family, putative membrane transport protein n=1 Tax=Geodermatophilus nigrescens TaxID=1070870 RepID=A0A1M5RJ43_9ACTN|nr:MFS transporter [Geodermatophilus nigrescens]SHH26347.1 MFS transporter, YNFM family, putative membrane transport protein [Geodermatophilus nigrescens]
MPPPGPRPGDPAPRRTSAAVFLAGLAVFAVLYAPQALLPELTRAFGVSPTAATLTVSAATVGLALGLLVLGPLSDRVGRTPVLHASLAAATVLAVLAALAPTWPVLLVLRGLQGFALAGLPAVGVAYLREELHPSVSSRAIGLFVGGTAIGGLSGRVLSGALADLGGWRTALGGIAALAVGCTVAVRVLLPASRRFTRVPRETPVLRQLARGFGDPVLLGLYALAALLMGGNVAVYNAVTFRLESEPYALSPALAGLVFLTYLLGSVSSPLAGGLAERAGRRLVVPVALLVAGAGLALTLARPLALVVAGLAVLNVGFFAAHGVASGWVAARAALGGRPVGQAASLYSFWYYVGSSVGGTLAGRAWADGGWPAAAAVAGTGFGGALLLALLLGRSRSLQGR